MAIRIRTINGVTVALCAYETDEKPGDIYLDDNAHHALSTKFGLDWHSAGFLRESLADPRLVEVMLIEKLRDSEKDYQAMMRPIVRPGPNDGGGGFLEECALCHYSFPISQVHFYQGGHCICRKCGGGTT